MRPSRPVRLPSRSTDLRLYRRPASLPARTFPPSSGRLTSFPFDQAGICSDADWTCGFLKHDWGNFDGVTEHWYTRAGVRWDRERAEKGIKVGRFEAGYVPDEETFLEWVRRPSDRAHLKGEEWREYERRYPEMKTKEIFMSNDEYAYTGGQTDLKLALAYLPVVQWAISQSVFQRRVMK